MDLPCTTWPPTASINNSRQHYIKVCNVINQFYIVNSAVLQFTLQTGRLTFRLIGVGYRRVEWSISRQKEQWMISDLIVHKQNNAPYSVTKISLTTAQENGLKLKMVANLQISNGVKWLTDWDPLKKFEIWTVKTCTNKKLSYCWETVRRENMPRIAEMDVEMTT